MERVTRVLLVLAVITLVGSGMAWARDPISIQSDADFTAANGVVAGRGTVDDPYVIAGGEVSASPDDVYGIRIENTRASFVLRGVTVQGVGGTGGAAIRIAFASAGRLEGCTVVASTNGIEIVASSGVVLRNCALSVTGLGLRVTGDTVENYNHDIDASNILNNQPIAYFYGLDGATVSGLTTSHLTVAGSRNVTVTGNSVINGDGLRLVFVTGSRVAENSVYRTANVYTEHGIFLLHSTDNIVELNSLRNNRLAGIQMTLSSRNIVRTNQFMANDSGIRLVASDENQISGNVLFANVSGILLSGGAGGNTVADNVVYHENTKQGISLEQADGNRIERNGISDCEVGVSLGELAKGNVIEANTILNGAYGIQLFGSYNWILKNLIAQESRGVLCPETYGRSETRGNEIRGNVFTDNGQHMYLNLDSVANHIGENVFLGDSVRLVADYGTGNAWTIGGVGNYWGAVANVDANGDAIGDTPVVVYPSTAVDAAPRASWTAVGAGLGILGTLPSSSVSIANAAGGVIQLSVLNADSGAERWAGFRGFPAESIERFPGVLFRFEVETQAKLTMQTVLFDLDVAFFAADGTYAGGTTMKANSQDLYTASGPFLYALELPAGSLARLGIVDGARLVIP